MIGHAFTGLESAALIHCLRLLQRSPRSTTITLHKKMLRPHRRMSLQDLSYSRTSAAQVRAPAAHVDHLLKALCPVSCDGSVAIESIT